MLIIQVLLEKVLKRLNKDDHIIYLSTIWFCHE